MRAVNNFAASYQVRKQRLVSKRIGSLYRTTGFSSDCYRRDIRCGLQQTKEVAQSNLDARTEDSLKGETLRGSHNTRRPLTSVSVSTVCRIGDDELV